MLLKAEFAVEVDTEYAANLPGGSGRGSPGTRPMGRVTHLNGAPWVVLKSLWVPGGSLGPILGPGSLG